MKKLGKRFEVYEETVRAYDFCDCFNFVCACHCDWYTDTDFSIFSNTAEQDAFTITFK